MTPTVSVFSICRLHLNRVVHLKDRTSGVRRHRDMNGDISKGCFKPAAWGKLFKEIDVCRPCVNIAHNTRSLQPSNIVDISILKDNNLQKSKVRQKITIRECRKKC